MSLLTDLGLGRRTLVMGVLNVTPDSFSDGGSYLQTPSAIARGMEMVDEGADILDIGGESTRPATFHDRSPLSSDEEKHRILPVIQGILRERPQAVISVDTYKADVAEAALDVGAKIINDISGLTFGTRMAAIAAASGVPYIMMHILGSPRDIPANPVYGDVVGDIAAFFERQIAVAIDRGIEMDNIVLDPGIGFGKTAAHNFEILRRLSELKKFGRPLLSGPSRKSFLGKALGGLPPSERLEGTAAAIALSIANGADIVRVHDVLEMVRVVKVSDAVVRGYHD